MSRFTCILALSLALATAAPVEERAANPTVTINDGVIVGTATSVLNQPTVTGLANAYLGVPFANSPPKRFEPPAAPKPWSTPLVAQSLPDACYQQFASPETAAYFNNPGLPPPTESEDCLYLNVFAPQNANSTNLKPVLFWIFGGNLQFGTASLAYYNGSSLAVNEDVVVVAANYRTNIFGFSNSPEVAFGEQNSGFLDQRFALQWVQDNIAAFGGDPSKVTLFGESAGGYSVKQLLANPPSPLPYRGAIMESEASGLPGNGTENFEKVVAHFNCSTAASQTDCLRQVPGATVRDYITQESILFPPVQNDGTYVASNSLPEISSGKFADVPILIGTNKNEGRIFIALAGLDNGSSPNGTDVVETIFTLTGRNITGILSGIVGELNATIDHSTYLLLSQIVTDLVFTCPASTLSSAIVAAGRQPVWRYRFDAVFPNEALFPDPGAYHSVEIPEVWGTYPLSNLLGNATPTQIALSKTMQKIWADFAKDPSRGAPWPKLGGNLGIELGILGGDKNQSGESTQSLLVADTPCLLYNPLNILEGGAY